VENTITIQKNEEIIMSFNRGTIALLKHLMSSDNLCVQNNNDSSVGSSIEQPNENREESNEKRTLQKIKADYLKAITELTTLEAQEKMLLEKLENKKQKIQSYASINSQLQQQLHAINANSQNNFILQKYLFDVQINIWQQVNLLSPQRHQASPEKISSDNSFSPSTNEANNIVTINNGPDDILNNFLKDNFEKEKITGNTNHNDISNKDNNSPEECWLEIESTLFPKSTKENKDTHQTTHKSINPETTISELSDSELPDSVFPEKEKQDEDKNTFSDMFNNIVLPSSISSISSISKQNVAVTQKKMDAHSRWCWINQETGELILSPINEKLIANKKFLKKNKTGIEGDYWINNVLIPIERIHKSTYDIAQLNAWVILNSDFRMEWIPDFDIHKICMNEVDILLQQPRRFISKGTYTLPNGTTVNIEKVPPSEIFTNRKSVWVNPDLTIASNVVECNLKNISAELITESDYKMTADYEISNGSMIKLTRMTEKDLKGILNLNKILDIQRTTTTTDNDLKRDQNLQCLQEIQETQETQEKIKTTQEKIAAKKTVILNINEKINVIHQNILMYKNTNEILKNELIKIQSYWNNLTQQAAVHTLMVLNNSRIQANAQRDIGNPLNPLPTAQPLSNYPSSIYQQFQPRPASSTHTLEEFNEPDGRWVFPGEFTALTGLNNSNTINIQHRWRNNVIATAIFIDDQNNQIPIELIKSATLKKRRELAAPPKTTSLLKKRKI